MRPDIPQKSGTDPSNLEDRSPLVDNRESVTSEVSRPSCNAAAMLGIAISVGAGSLATPVFQNSAHATEAAAKQAVVKESSTTVKAQPLEPVSRPVAIAPKAAAKLAEAVTKVEPSTKELQVGKSAVQENLSVPNAKKTAPVAQSEKLSKSLDKLTAASVTGHAVEKGETLWQIAKAYEVEVRALANVNRLSTDSVLKIGQVLNLPTKASVKPVGNPDAVVSLKKISKSVPAVPELASSQAGELQSKSTTARQAVVANRLQGKRETLKRSTAELGEDVNQRSDQAVSQAFVNESSRNSQDGLPVTRLSEVPLPAIGGSEPQKDLKPTAESAIDVSQSVEASESSEATKIEAVALQRVDAGAQFGKLKPVKSTPAKFDPTPLLAEIHNLRERHNRTAAKSAASNLKTSPNRIVMIAQAQSEKLKSEPVQKIDAKSVTARVKKLAANPDFSGRKSDSALSIELRNFVQPKLKSETKEKSAPSAKRRVVARATLGSSAYAPVTPAVKKMVSPDLPAIGNEDAFLPGGNVSRGYVWPSKGVLSSGYGWRWGRMHRGIDIAAPVGTPIVSVAAGKVSYARWNNGGYGYLVEVEHPDGTMTRYAHNSRILVKEGQEVAQGQQISEMGSTGFSTGPHLHFEMHRRGRGAVNPMAFLRNQS